MENRISPYSYFKNKTGFMAMVKWRFPTGVDHSEKDTEGVVNGSNQPNK
jgi:hypothetical protein